MSDPSQVRTSAQRRGDPSSDRFASPPTDAVSDLLEARERDVNDQKVRSNLAYVSVGLFVLVVLMGFVGAVWSEAVWTRTQDLLQIVVPIVTLLIGGTVAHYFERRR